MTDCTAVADDLDTKAAANHLAAVAAKKTYDDLSADIVLLKAKTTDLQACLQNLMSQCAIDCAGAINDLNTEISTLNGQILDKQTKADAALTQFKTLSAQALSEALGALKLRGNPAPNVTKIQPSTAKVGDPDLVMHALGGPFSPLSVIVFNHGDERTDYHSAGDVSTIVKPSTASGPWTVPVAVRNPDGQMSNAVNFTFTEDPVIIPSSRTSR